MTRAQTIALLKVIIPVVGIVARDAVGVIGVLAVVHGVSMFSTPAGWIVGGIVMVAFAVLTTRRKPA